MVRVRTVDPDRPTASAIAIHDGTIITVGGAAELRAACDGRTEVVDGQVVYTGG